MRNIYFTLLVMLLLGCDAYAANKTPQADKSFHPFSSHLPWSLEVGLGYGKYQNMLRSDGTTVLARIGIAKQIVRMQAFSAGIEMGVQSGNTARLSVPDSIENELGGLPVDSTIKPSLDLLLTAKVYPLTKRIFFTQIKAGAISRRWQFTRGSVNDVSKVNPEIQIGIGYDVNRVASVSLSYQGIFGNNPDFKIVTEDCLAHVSGIPGENSVILGLSVYLDEGMKT